MLGFGGWRATNFDEWMEDVGLTEDDLADLYRIAKRRSVILGILSLTPLGLFLSPFWLWASGLTKAIRYRSFGTQQNVLVSLVWFLWGMMSLFIYPLVIMWAVIPATRWCSRTDGRDALVPFLTVTAIILTGLAITTTPIPLIAAAALYLMFRSLRAGRVGLAALILVLGLAGSGAYLLASNRVELPSPQAFLDKLPDAPAESVGSAAESVRSALGGIAGKVRSLRRGEEAPAAGASSNREEIVGFWCSFYSSTDITGAEYLWAEQMEFGRDGSLNSRTKPVYRKEAAPLRRRALLL